MQQKIIQISRRITIKVRHKGNRDMYKLSRKQSKSEAPKRRMEPGHTTESTVDMTEREYACTSNGHIPDYDLNAPAGDHDPGSVHNPLQKAGYGPRR